MIISFDDSFSTDELDDSFTFSIEDELEDSFSKDELDDDSLAISFSTDELNSLIISFGDSFSTDELEDDSLAISFSTDELVDFLSFSADDFSLETEDDEELDDDSEEVDDFSFKTEVLISETTLSSTLEMTVEFSVCSEEVSFIFSAVFG